MAQDYDKIFKENIESIFLTLSEKVLHFKPQVLADIVPDFQRTIERKPDFLKKVKNPESDEIFLLQIEIQSTEDGEMLYRMYEYRALIFRRYKLNIRQIVIYVGEGISRMRNSFEDGLNKFHYDLFSIQSIPYQIFIESDNPEELLLSILGNFDKESAESILEKMFKKAKKVVNETFSMEKFVVQLEAFAQFRNYFEPYKLILNKVMPIEFKIEDSYLYKLGEEKGLKRAEEAEKKRKEAENKHKDAEKRRKEAENRRVEAEKQRIEAEKKAEFLKVEMITSLLKMNKMSHKEIAEIADVSLEYVSKLADRIK